MGFPNFDSDGGGGFVSGGQSLFRCIEISIGFAHANPRPVEPLVEYAAYFLTSVICVSFPNL